MDTPGPSDLNHETGILRITVVNGDLTFEGEALLLGHYHATRLTGTEKVMDRLIGGAMGQSLAMGVYPVAIGSHQIFINTHPNVERGTFIPRPRAVVIAGLGDEGKLRALDLVQSVRQAVIAWAQRLAEEGPKIPGTFELTSTLLGSGGTGVSPGEAARLIAEGVYQANLRIAEEDDSRAKRRTPRVGRLRFIELYLDRATEAWRSLRLQSDARPGRFVVDEVVEEGTGALERPADPGYRGAEFDFISVAATTDREGVAMISYTLDTRRARSEVRAQRTQSLLIKELVAAASNDQNNDQQIGRTLFGLLIPIELEAYLAGSGEMQIELDPQTAAIPWELLDTHAEIDATAAGDEELPWALRVNLLRKLRIAQFRELVTDAGPDASALVIGAPETPPAFPRLPGARAEAEAVRSRLMGPGGLGEGAVMALVSPDADQPGPSARDVVNALFDRSWRVVHIAGHGAPGGGAAAGGVVLSNGTFLGAAEIGNMRVVPELVFINCCHLGAADPGQLLNTYDRAAFASGVAGELIAIGVRCVIAAGWAVDDEGARVFADEFYSSLLRGSRFITAAGGARLAAYRHAPDQNTWAAYQCYGDPDWTFRQLPPDPNRPAVRVSEDFTGVASATALKLALQRIIIEVRFQSADPGAKLDGVRSLETHYAQRWGERGDVAELFGEAFAEAGDIESGLRWYEKAVAAVDGRASMKSAEQLGTLRSQFGWALVDQASRARGETRTRAKSLRAAISRADGLLQDAVTLLEQFAEVEPTSRRLDLIGSAYKHRALINIAAGRRARVRRDLTLMAASYGDAQRLAARGGTDAAPSYAANALLAEVALNAGQATWRKLDAKRVAVIEAWMKKAEPTFVSVIGAIELDQYRALADRRLAASLPALEAAYADVYSQVTSVRLWRAVYDAACLVLPNYAAKTPATEKAAATALLARLRGYAHPRQARRTEACAQEVLMQTIEGFDYFPLVFDRNGKVESDEEFDTFIQRSAGWPATDAIFIAHGFRNDVDQATTLYASFLKNVRAHLQRPEFGEVASRRFVVAGVYWPSKAFRETFGGTAPDGTRAFHNPTLAMADARQQLEELKIGATPAQRRSLDKAAALLPRLEGNTGAQDTFVDLVLSILSRSRLDATEGLPQIREQSGSDLLAKLDEAPGDGTRGVLGSIAGKVGQFLNLTTWYLMKDRSGIVGAKGLGPAVRKLRTRAPHLRIHLVGHSLGGRLMAACAKELSGRPKIQPDSLTLLAAAFSHYGFSADNGRGTAGFFRDVIAKRVVKGPFLSTFSAEDTVVGKAYAISSRLARDNSRDIGDADDEFGGIGRNGALKTSEVAHMRLHKPGTTYEYAIGMINNLDGSGGMIKNHGDVTNPAVTYAFAAALARVKGGHRH